MYNPTMQVVATNGEKVPCQNENYTKENFKISSNSNFYLMHIIKSIMKLFISYQTELYGEITNTILSEMHEVITEIIDLFIGQRTKDTGASNSSPNKFRNGSTSHSKKVDL